MKIESAKQWVIEKGENAVKDDRLSQRKQLILQAIVDAHIACGEPVGSKLLAENKQLACSSATIRNEMAELESLGYLEQPHTSAGRVPSELGYRFYVDSLLERYQMTTHEIECLNLSLQSKMTELDRIFGEASRLAATMTNYAGIAARHKTGGVRISRFETVYIDEYHFVLVMVFGGDLVRSKTVHLSFGIERHELERLNEALNARLTHRTCDEVALSAVFDIESLLGRAAPVVSPLIKIIYETISEVNEGELQVDGVDRLLSYPEYANLTEFRSILGVLDRKTPILDVIASAADEDIGVYIGSENTVDVMSNSTLIFKKIRRDGQVIGTIGVIGPCRMDYSKVIETLNHLADGISRALADGAAPHNLLKGPDKDNG